MDPLDPIDGEPVWWFGEGEPVVAGYLAWERLGTGTRCETWLAWSVEAWAPVVVKLARPHQVTHQRGIAAVAREVAALGAVAHPALPRLLADGRSSPIPHLVQQYVDGPSLGDILDDSGPWSVLDSCLLAGQIVSAIRALHAAGFAHLDLKPDNIVIQNGRAVVVDLGSARAIGHRQPEGKPIGTAGYASPDLEQGRDVSAAMDVYGVGTILAEALTGAPPFDDERTAGERPEPSTVTSGLSSDVPPALRQFVTSMLAVEPVDRPTTDEVLLTLPAIVGSAEAEDKLWPAWAAAALSPCTLPLAETAAGSTLPFPSVR